VPGSFVSGVDSELLARIFFLVLVLCGPLVLAADAGGRSSAVGHRNGAIAFANGASELDVINPDGSGQRGLSRCECFIFAYAWAPSGRHLAYLGAPAVTSGPYKAWLYVVDSGGARTRRLAYCGDCVPWSSLSWSADGSRIVFARRDGLRVVNVRTRAHRRLTKGRFDADPAWSPGGSTIAFARGNRLDTVDLHALRVVKLAGVAGMVGHPSWTRDGTRIAFDGSDGIYVVNTDGSGLTLLRAGSRGSGPGVPSWSPNDDRILFLNTPGTPGAFTAEIWTMKSDGSDQRRLYASPCCVGLWNPPIWSPDGEWIAFSADSAGGILLMDANGEHLRRLSEIPTEVAWQPAP